MYVGSGSYRGPKYNDKCVVVRAIAISDDGNQSEVVTKSYFVNNNHFEEDTTVISLVTDMKNLVDKNGDPKERIVCDYVGAMTDRFAIAMYEELYIPKSWHG